jgi:hypothetical protein
MAKTPLALPASNVLISPAIARIYGAYGPRLVTQSGL